MPCTLATATATTTESCSHSMREVQSVYRAERILSASHIAAPVDIDIDTAYHLYSRRLPGGRVGCPVTVYASSAVLKAAAPYFVAQLDGGFATVQAPAPETDAYGYEDDSDIEGGFGLEDDDRDLAEDVNADADTDADADAGTPADSEDGTARFGQQSTADRTAQRPPRDGEGKVKFHIVVPDVAAATWRAMVHYIHTGRIAFAPLRSQGVEARRQAVAAHRARNPSPDTPAPCSPKSMYRLADIIGLDELRDLAFEDIRRNMTMQMVVAEVFSPFSSLYPAVRDMQLEVLCGDGDDALAQALPALQERLREAADTRLLCALGVVDALVAKLSASLLLVRCQCEREVEKVKGGARRFDEGAVRRKEPGENIKLCNAVDGYRDVATGEFVLC